MSRIPLPPYPNGWFAVAHSDQLARGQTRAVHYLGRDLVAVARRGRPGAGGRRLLPAPRRAPGQGRQGRRRHHPVSVPRLALRRPRRALRRDPLRQADSARGPARHAAGARVQRHGPGLAPPGGQGARVEARGRARDPRPALRPPRHPRVDDQEPPAGDHGERRRLRALRDAARLEVQGDPLGARRPVLPAEDRRRHRRRGPGRHRLGHHRRRLVQLRARLPVHALQGRDGRHRGERAHARSAPRSCTSCTATTRTSAASPRS